jgi:hypothetical protein
MWSPFFSSSGAAEERTGINVARDSKRQGNKQNDFIKGGSIVQNSGLE